MQLTKTTRKQLRDALLDAFDALSLERLLYFELGQRYDQLVRFGSDYRTHVADVIRTAEQEGWVDKLMVAVRRARPDHHLVQLLSGSTQETGDGALSDSPAAARQPLPSIGLRSWPEPSIPYVPLSENMVRTLRDAREMVLVPAGSFLFGEGERRSRPHLPDFWIDRTPVTNAAYKQFLDANPTYPVPWRDASWAQAYCWDRRQRTFPLGKANHPVVLVTWYDALAYATWVGKSLPTEQEWEKAARGTSGWMYPWGNDWREAHCNSRAANLQGTSAVGLFSPQGDSPFACIDMAGNVWEWCSDAYRHAVDTTNVPRATRGGSWADADTACRAAARAPGMPSERYNKVGFRLNLRLVSA